MPSLDGPPVPAPSSPTTGEPTAGAATATELIAPPTGRVRIPFTVGITLAVCVAFTIFAGVSSPVIDFARQATLIF